MSKCYRVVKLAPNVSSWCDKENNIYLSRPNKMSKRLKEDCDMKMINKGVKAGLLFLEVHCEEQEQKHEEKVEKVIESIIQTSVPEDIEIPEAVQEVKKPRTKRKKEENNEVKVEVNIIKDEE
jgi:hypothetical protein